MAENVTLSYRARLRQIARIMVKHGFGFLLSQWGLSRWLPLREELMERWEEQRGVSRAAHLRLALEELGTTFIKLGQVLSTRADLLPPEYLQELSRLQTEVAAVPVAAIKEMMEQELGQETSQLFAEFEDKPLASASIGQVHRARLRDGQRVVVKVQRPGVEELVRLDLEIIQFLARQLQKRTDIGTLLDLEGLVDEFAATLRAELDYIQEGRNAERFRRIFAGEKNVYIPQVFWDFTTRRVLVMEEIQGIKVDDMEALERAGMDKKELARTSSRLFMHLVFNEGFFHADLHPGNLLILPGGVIGLLDFGMVGHLDEETRDLLLQLLLSFLRRETEEAVEILLQLGVTPGSLNRRRLKEDMTRLINCYYGLPLGEIKIGHVLSEILHIAYRHRLRMPTSLTLLAKTVLMSEGIGRRLDPEFNLVEVVRPMAEALLREQYGWRRSWQRLQDALFGYGRLWYVLPRHLRGILRKVEDGNLSFGLEVRELDRVLAELNAMVNRLSISVLTASFIVGLSVILAVVHPRGWDGLASWIFTIGFFLASGMGAWLMFSIWRSRKK